jgi:hypothetical protein
MKKSVATRIDIQDGSFTKRQEPVHSIVVALRTKLENDGIIVNDLRDGSQYTSSKAAALVNGMLSANWYIPLETSFS